MFKTLLDKSGRISVILISIIALFLVGLLWMNFKIQQDFSCFCPSIITFNQ